MESEIFQLSYILSYKTLSEADLPERKRFNFYWNFTDDFPLRCHRKMFDY